jgi:hypothetical protein
VSGPRDEEILRILEKPPGWALTSVVRRELASAGRGVFTSAEVLHWLKRLERDGKVERMPSVYVAPLGWRLARGR